jgi:hypothetical protein
MLLQICKVRFSLFISRGTQALIIFYFPFTRKCPLGFVPVIIVLNREETVRILPLRNLNKRSNELLHEGIGPDEFGPEVMNEINNQAFDVGAIVILICHYH